MQYEPSQLEDGLDDMRRCVNSYMDVIAEWSSDVRNPYRYYYC